MIEPMPTYDFSKPETQALYEAEVRTRVERFGMTREQAETLVAILMWKGPLDKPESEGRPSVSLSDPLPNTRLDIARRDDMIRDLREALKFYADPNNYKRHGWQGDPDPSLVESDRGTIACDALEGKKR